MSSIDYQAESPYQEKKWYKKWWGILILSLLTIVTILFLLFAGYVAYLSWQIYKMENEPVSLMEKIKQQPQYLNTIGTDEYWLGSNDPKLTIVMFSDFECPATQSSWLSLHNLVEKYQDQVKFVHRDYPLSDESMFLAKAALCAGEQGKFWLTHYHFFINQGEINEANIIDSIENLGLEKNQFLACVQTDKYNEKFKTNYSDGQKFEIQGTPTWFFNGYKIPGDIPAEILETIIQEFLK